MKDHKFVYKDSLNDKNIYLVVCKKTGGEFSTKDWDNNICLCCKEVIR